MNFEDNKGLFVEEARELLESIESRLLELEQAPGDEAIIDDVFRSLHTIKGSGAMFGFEEMTAFAHGLESLFDDVRKGRLGVTGEIVGLTLESVDCLSSLLEGRDDEAARARGSIESRLEAVRRGAEPAPEADAKPPAAAGSSATDKAGTAGGSKGIVPIAADDPSEAGLTNVYRIRFRPDADLLGRGVKLENLFSELAELGTVVAVADASRVPELDALEPSSLYLSWILTLSTTASEADVSSVFMFVEDYAELKIERLPVVDAEGKPAVPPIGELLAARGALARDSIDEIRGRQKPFGELALEAGKVSKPELEAALAEQRMAKAAGQERENKKESASIRVRKEKLDYLVDAVGELVILQARLRQAAAEAGLDEFSGIAEDLSRLTDELRDATMNIRMVPLDESFSGFPRLVHDLAAQLGKELTLTLRGGATELDKNIIESLKDPLVHIIRNSADHGVESPEERERAGKPRAGTITIEARQQGSRVEIEIADDGAGLDLERVRERGVERGLIDASERDPERIKSLIFEPGFSTARQTTGVSGRGVGMDVVRSNLRRLRGDVSIATEPGRGTAITLSIPLTLVIVDGLLVRVGGVHYVVNLSQVLECVDEPASGRAGRGARGFIDLRGKTIPIVDLRERFGLGCGDERADRRLVIIDDDGSVVALWVDAVVDKQQVVIKPFTMDLRQIASIAGATVLGDGSVALILNSREIIKTLRRDERAQTKECT